MMRKKSKFFFLFGRILRILFSLVPPRRVVSPQPLALRAARSSAASFPTRTTATPPRAAMDVGPSVPPVEDFAGYNTARSKDLHATLVGNWVEERQLEADTGVFRYKPWVEELREPRVDASVTGARPARTVIDRRSPAKTHDRVVAHSERLESGAWTSDAKTAHADPAAASPGAPFDFGEAVGPRRAAALARMLAEASVEPPARPNDHAMGSHGERGVASVTRSDYDVDRSSAMDDDDHRVDAPRLGARVMYTQDGVYIPPSARDATFASETLRKPKGLVDAARLRNGHALDAPGGAGRPAAAVLAERAPTALGSGCTVYSHRVDRGVYPDADVFGTTVGGVNPFGRNSAFSMPVTDPRKKEEDAA